MVRIRWPEALVASGGALVTGIADDAAAAVAEFWAEHPALLARERELDRVDPITKPLEYWNAELTEPDHAAVAALVQEAGGVLELAAVEAWMETEAAEEREGGEEASLRDAAMREVMALAAAPLPGLGPHTH